LKAAATAVTAAGMSGASSAQARPHTGSQAAGGTGAAPDRDGAADRAYWVAVLRRLADPVLESLAAGQLVARMPVEGPANRRSVTHLEAVGRLLTGIAPWLELGPADSDEGRLRQRYADLARRALAVGLDKSSPDALNFTEGAQPLVDAAFLAQAVLRAPSALWRDLDGATRQALVAALESTRAIQPSFSNWLLFSATIEAALAAVGAAWDRVRVDYALRQHEQWYKGDGTYGDGPEFHWDYYNSFVIHPMLLDVLDACAPRVRAWQPLVAAMTKRAQRYAAVQERLIAPDGSWPLVGRSLAYRAGAFHLLAQAALRHALPAPLAPAAVRSALTAAIRRSLDAQQTFDAGGWLRVGVCGHQPGVGETYISTGSLYLCATVLLPLGLPGTDSFWAGPAAPWTSVLAWSGRDFPIDHAL
jgi:hypothetical protein